jgi:hypothetical protein
MRHLAFLGSAWFTARLVGLLVATAFAACTYGGAYPSDDAIRQLFKEHREAFEKLAQMVVEDSHTISSFALAQDWCSGPLPKARQEQYRALMSGIKPDLQLGTDSILISFDVWGGGEGLSVNRSWFKGLAFFPNELRADAKVVAQLNTRPEDDGTYIVPLGGKWYIIYLQVD